MSQISDMYEQIKLQQYTLMKMKLQEAVKARKEKRDFSEEEKKTIHLQMMKLLF